MNRLCFLLIILCSCHSQAQQPTTPAAATAAPADTIETFNGEFTVYQNGLIYSPNTVNQLTHIVDSLNLKFKRCDLTKPFMSLRQGIGYYVSINKGHAKAAAKDMAAGMGLQALVKKYNAGVDSLQFVIQPYQDGNTTTWQFEGLTFKQYNDVAIYKKGKTDYNTASLANKWVMSEPGEDDDLDAVYFNQEPRATPIPEKYARMILYTECVIDTTADIYTGAKNNDYFGRQHPQWEKGYKKTKLFAFKNYLEKNTAQFTAAKLPKGYKDYDEYRGIDSMKKAYVRSTLSTQPDFKNKLADAIAEFNEGSTGTEDGFEYYVANYHSKKLALDMKRKRRVIGQCSMDNSPRMHAQQIAMLSAEAVNWETFLRAHLNIMNDRFDRVSDASWSRARRQTYIKELETLNLDVNDLLIGISLRTGNAAARHYYGNISRLGRAFAETANKELLVNTLLAGIANEQLDNYNRVLLFYLLNHYAYNLTEKGDREKAYEQLRQVIKTLPDPIEKKIRVIEQH